MVGWEPGKGRTTKKRNVFAASLILFGTANNLQDLGPRGASSSCPSKETIFLKDRFIQKIHKIKKCWFIFYIKSFTLNVVFLH